MSTSLTTLVPLLTGPQNYNEWASRMEAYLGSQGQWTAMTKRCPMPLTLVDSMEYEVTPATKDAPAKMARYPVTEYSDDPDKVEKREDQVDAWMKTDTMAKGNICLRLHHTIAYQHKDVPTALQLWTDIKDKYGKPGPGIAYIELRKALSTRLPSNADPSPAFDKMTSTFGRLQEMGFPIPVNIQVLLLLAQFPSPEMDGVAQDLASAKSEDFAAPQMLQIVRQRLNIYWENKVGKKSAQGGGQQKANKILAVKRDQGPTTFSDQQDRGEESSRGGRGQGRGRGGRRGKRGGQKQANQAEEEKEGSRPSSSMGMIASSIFMPPPPLPTPQVFPPPPPSSIYPSFNSALSLARQIDAQPTIETLKRLEIPELTRDPRLTKKRRLEDRLSKSIDDEVVSLGSTDDEMDLDEVLAISAGLVGSSGTSPRYDAQLVPLEETNIPTVSNLDRKLDRLEINTLSCAPLTDNEPYCKTWLLDSGASCHFTYDLSDFIDIQDIPHVPLQTANGQANATKKGTIILQLSTQSVRLYPVYYVPDLKTRLMSLGSLLQAGLHTRGSAEEIAIYQGK